MAEPVPTTGTAVALGTLALEATLALTVQQILKREGISDPEKRVQARTEIDKALLQGVRRKKRLFFGAPIHDLERVMLTTSVAVEELHECYLDHCDLQKTGLHWGVLFSVYSGRGMGKSLSSLSLLLHKHSRAPKQGIFFGGKTIFETGDQ